MLPEVAQTPFFNDVNDDDCDDSLHDDAVDEHIHDVKNDDIRSDLDSVFPIRTISCDMVLPDDTQTRHPFFGYSSLALRPASLLLI